MIIKTMEEGDADSFYKLCEDFYSSGATKRAYDRKSAELTFRQVISKHENLWGYFIIDVESGSYAGYALITSYWCNEEAGNVLILDELFVSPEFRHRHFGKSFWFILHYKISFMIWLEQEFRGKAVALTLEVLSTNVIAKDLYLKDGFSEDGFVTMTKVIT